MCRGSCRRDRDRLGGRGAGGKRPRSCAEVAAAIKLLRSGCRAACNRQYLGRIPRAYARHLHQPFEPGSEYLRRHQGVAGEARIRAGLSRFRQGQRDRRRRELGAAALRGTGALPRRHPGADAQLARLDLVPDRTGAGACARQGDPAGAVRAARRALRAAGGAGRRSGGLERRRARTARPAAQRHHQRTGPRLPPASRPLALSGHPRLRGRGRGDLFRPRRRDPRRDRAARRAAHPGRRAPAGDHRRIRIGQVVAAARRRAATNCPKAPRVDSVAADPAREGAARNHRQGNRHASRQAAGVAKLAPAPGQAGGRQRRRRTGQGPAHRRIDATPRCCCRSTSSKRCSPSRPPRSATHSCAWCAPYSTRRGTFRSWWSRPAAPTCWKA